MDAGEDEYTLELKTQGLDEQEQAELLDRIEDDLGVEFTEDEQREELHDPVTIIGFYSAGVGTLGLFLQLYEWLQEEDEPAMASVQHYGNGDVYIIDADEANQVGADILERNEDTVVAELSVDEALELKRIREEDE